MRIWSIHPKHLDAKGLVALWRETLLAKHVLEGRTKGYRSHPQLDRFKRCPNPAEAINRYLEAVHEEAVTRGYRFDGRKFVKCPGAVPIPVTRGQMDYEIAHLQAKLKLRDASKFRENKARAAYEPHPLFKVVKGGVEKWEVIK